MNHKTIRAYQFKADEAVRTLEESGAQWVVGKGKPHWELPVAPKENLENMRMEIRKDFARIFDKHVIAALAEADGVTEEISGVGKQDEEKYEVEIGPQTFNNTEQFVGADVFIRKIPNWHKAERRLVNRIFKVVSIEYVNAVYYKGQAVVFRIGSDLVWLPLSCVQFKL